MSDTGALPPVEKKPPTAAAKQKRRRKSAKTKNIFADCIILLCLAMCVYITVTAVGDYHRLNKVMSASVLMALFGMWSGELLIIMLRQVLGSDVVTQCKGYEMNSGLMGCTDYSDYTSDGTNLSV